MGKVISVFFCKCVITALYSTELLKLCKEKYNLNFCPGEMYACLLALCTSVILICFDRTSANGDFKDHIRLAFCHYAESELKEGVAKLSQAIKN